MDLRIIISLATSALTLALRWRLPAVTKHIADAIIAGALATMCWALFLSQVHWVVAVLTIALVVVVTGIVSFTLDNRSAESDRGYVTLLEAGIRIYKQYPHIRNAIAGFLHEAFNSTEEGAESYALVAAEKRGVQIYARRGDSLPLEPITAQDARHNAANAQFDPKMAELKDVSICRRDLNKVVRYYESLWG